MSFRVGATQRKILYGCVVVGVVCLGVAALAAFQHAYGVAILPGLYGLLLVTMGLDTAVGRTELTAQGLETRSIFRSRSCRWDEVAGIGTSAMTGMGNTNTRIIIRLKGRRSMKLCAPYNSTMVKDPFFQHSLAQIKYYWSKYAPK